MPLSWNSRGFTILYLVKCENEFKYFLSGKAFFTEKCA
jgi:hypothetical protein